MRRRVLVIATYVVGCGSNSGAPKIDAAIPDSFVAVDAPIDAPPPRRELGLEIEAPGSATQGQEISVAMPFGVGVIPLTIPWSTLEPGGSGFDMATVNLLNAGMTYYRSVGLHVMLSVPAVDTVAVLIPSDLGSDSLDSPTVTARAQAMITEVLAQCGTELEYLVLSNEVDINLADGTPTWAQLDGLTAAEVERVHTIRPDVKTGVSVTSSSLLSSPPNADAVAALHANDVAFLTYYDAGNFGAASSAGIAADMATILAATDRPVVFKEFGYATGSDLGGSDYGQTVFVGDAFTAWDTNAARVPLLVYSRMFDDLQATCQAEATAYGEGSNAAFVEFLCTLGLRTYADQPKAAWSTFTAAAQARTWGP